MLKNIKNFPIDGHLFTFYDHSNHLIYLTRAGSDQILILQFDLVNESICLSKKKFFHLLFFIFNLNETKKIF